MSQRWGPVEILLIDIEIPQKGNAWHDVKGNSPIGPLNDVLALANRHHQACGPPALSCIERNYAAIKPWKKVMTISQSVTHHTARLNGINQHWVSAGDGPPVYLLHGFPETWYAWRKQIPVLAERYTVIAPDLRGYGDTEKPACGYDKRTMANDLAALMDHLGHERAPILGHDRGARVGTRFAKDHRERIDRFVAMDNVPTRILMENPSRAGHR